MAGSNKGSYARNIWHKLQKYKFLHFCLFSPHLFLKPSFIMSYCSPPISHDICSDKQSPPLKDPSLTISPCSPPPPFLALKYLFSSGSNSAKHYILPPFTFFGKPNWKFFSCVCRFKWKSTRFWKRIIKFQR